MEEKQQETADKKTLRQEIPVYSEKYGVHGKVLDYGVVTKLVFLYRKFLKSSEIVYNRLEIKNDITKERRGLRHDVVYEVFCFGLG